MFYRSRVFADSLDVVQSLVKSAVNIGSRADEGVGGVGLVGGELSKEQYMRSVEGDGSTIARTSQNIVPARPLLTTY